MSKIIVTVFPGKKRRQQKCDFPKCCFSCALGRQSNFKVGPLLTLFSNPLPTPLLTRPLKNDFYHHFGVSECTSQICATKFILYQANGRGGFGSQTAADPSCRPPTAPEKQTLGTVTASHRTLTLQALLSSLSMPALQREAAWAMKRLLRDLQQSVPQSGHVHLHITLSIVWGYFLEIARAAKNNLNKKK